MALAGLLAASALSLNVGTGIYDITGPSQGVNFMGMANPSQKGAGIHFRLRARAFIFEEAGERVAMVSLDAGMGGYILKKRVLASVAATLGTSDLYMDKNVAISGTHTHSGPSGFLEHTIFQFAGSGWVPATVDAMVSGTAEAIVRAHNALAPSDVHIGTKLVGNASANRSPTAYLLNPAEEREKYEAVGGDADQTMVQLSVAANGSWTGVLNWHATHGTSMNNTNVLVSGDNKGWASYLLERDINGPTSDARRVGAGPFVAAFAATALGDVSPNTLGARCRDTGLPCDAIHSTCNGRSQQCSSVGPGKDMFESTGIIAQRQLDVAAALLQQVGTQPAVEGPVGSVHSYVKMPGRAVADVTGAPLGHACSAALGVSFAAGTTDGPGMFDFTQGAGNSSNPFWRFIGGLLHKATPEEKACQAPKAILLSTGDITFPYPWAPDTVEVQLLRVGQLVIVSVPTEMSTMAGRRTRDAVKQRLVSKGVLSADGVVVIAGLTNGYADYTVTKEEYQQQRYEGGSTIFGPLQLDAYIQELVRIADSLADGTTPTTDPPPEDFTGRVHASGSADPKAEEVPSGKAFGDVLADVPVANVSTGTTVSVTFLGGSLNNDLKVQSTFMRVERLLASGGASTWALVAEDGDIETRVSVVQDGLLSKKHEEVTCRWDVPPGAAPGTYRITHQGAYWHAPFIGKAEAVAYEGSSSSFNVI